MIGAALFFMCAAAPEPRDVPAKTIPLPTTISPALMAVIAQPLHPGWNTPPVTPGGWAQLARQTEATVGAMAQSHAQFFADDRIPEDRFAIGEIAEWFDSRLGRK